jgi:uncharacterized protein (TIGR02301 family)
MRRHLPFLALVLFASPVLEPPQRVMAQDKPTAEAAAPADPGAAPPADAQSPTASPAPPAPYEGPLLRLSELMGSLHYLRGLCHAADAQEWRQRMVALLDSEADDEARRSRLAGAFNRGYRTFQQTYRSCNASAQTTIAAYVEEGRKITKDIGTRFAD